MLAWTTTGFASEVAASPHAMLAKNDLAVAESVVVRAFGFRSAARHLCPTCQLAIPGIYVALKRMRRRDPLSPLDSLFAHASGLTSRALAKPHGVLAELGLAVSANVRAKIRLAPTSSLELQLCEAYHACLCATPELQPIVFRNWPR